jgi:hypothetical protein
MQTRAQYDQAFQLVREVIATWDPYSLIAGGAPPDEFDDEIARLLARLRGATSSTDVSEAVLSVFGEAFGESGFDVGSCAEVGQQIYSRMSAAGLLSDAPKKAQK